MGGPEPSHRAPPSTRLPLVIGVGNEDRGDDAFGLRVARRLRPRLTGLGEVVEQASEGTTLLDLWAERERVWVVDAIRAGGTPGSLYRIEVGADQLPTPLSVGSSHDLSLGQAVSLAQVLNRLPGHLVIHGVEPARFEAGEPLSPLVARAVEDVARRVEIELRSHRSPDPPGRGRSDA